LTEAAKEFSTKPKLGTLFWLLATLVMLVAAGYQRRAGPTYPLRGQTNVGGEQMNFRLPRSAENTGAAKVTIPDLGIQARLLWRRYPMDEPFTVVFFAPEVVGGKNVLTAEIPSHDAAGKVEYMIEIAGQTIPDDGEAVILRFKGLVSAPLLVSHILAIFAGMLVSTRAGIGAAFGRDGGRSEKMLPWVSLVMIALGGLVLGPFVQKAAFGAYWTGWPFGSDLTDNKTVLMFIGWLAACLLTLHPKARRSAVVAASLLTIVAYLIPHSLRGSQLDYHQGIVQTGQ
jgi:hypothetical protein